MAQPIRVVWRGAFGAAMIRARQSSEEEKERQDRLNLGLDEKWKNDPGIRYICYYASPAKFDGYVHHVIYEVDDVSKVQEMGRT